MKAARAARKPIPAIFQGKKQCASLGRQLSCTIVSGGRNTKHTVSKCHGFVGEQLVSLAAEGQMHSIPSERLI